MGIKRMVMLRREKVEGVMERRGDIVDVFPEEDVKLVTALVAIDATGMIQRTDMVEIGARAMVTTVGIKDTSMVMIDRSAAAVITREDIKMVMGITDTVMVMIDRSAAAVTSREDIERAVGITDAVMVMVDRSAAAVTTREDIERVMGITDVIIIERIAIKATNREESAGIRLAGS
jgi:hypothetical protein